jgi:hypothetical protein
VRVIFDRINRSLPPVHVRFARKRMRGWRTKRRVEVGQTSEIQAPKLGSGAGLLCSIGGELGLGQAAPWLLAG